MWRHQSWASKAMMDGSRGGVVRFKCAQCEKTRDQRLVLEPDPKVRVWPPGRGNPQAIVYSVPAAVPRGGPLPQTPLEHLGKWNDPERTWKFTWRCTPSHIFLVGAQ